jgi:hypothetical protein
MCLGSNNFRSNSTLSSGKHSSCIHIISGLSLFTKRANLDRMVHGNSLQPRAFNSPIMHHVLFVRRNYDLNGNVSEIFEASYLLGRPSKIKRHPVLIISDQSFLVCMQLRFPLICTHARSKRKE